MRLSISNIAWDAAEDAAVATLLQAASVNAIDVAASKYFARPEQASAHDIAAVRKWWAGRGIAIIGMQALLFGTEGRFWGVWGLQEVVSTVPVFGPPPVQDGMLQHLGHMCRIGAGLGATRLVFGSPRNRDRSGLDDAAASAVALPFLRRLGEIALQHGVTICLEPNPARYGANFMTGAQDTLELVMQVDHPAIRMQFDSGALAIDGADPLAMLAQCAPYVGHIHASEPDLVTLGDGATDHGAMADAIARYLGHYPVTIEMVASKTEPHRAAIARALDVAVRHYRREAP